MSATPPDIREQEDCPGGYICHWNCDQHAQRIAEPLPVMRHKGPNDTDESVFERMAWNLRNGYPAGGSNACDALARLIDREVARARGVAS